MSPHAPCLSPQVRSNLHVVLCMSPVGDAFRVRCRMFPALTACTAIDWFHPWPTAALISVAMRFLEDVDLGADAVRPPCNLPCGHSATCAPCMPCTLYPAPCTLHPLASELSLLPEGEHRGRTRTNPANRSYLAPYLETAPLPRTLTPDPCPRQVRENVCHHMSFVHESVGRACGEYLKSERRQIYTTPKSYLELIALYKKLLAEQTSKLEAQQERLEIGLIKLRSSAGQVAEMQAQLKDEQVVVENKKAETDALLVQVGQESSVADEQSQLAAIEEDKVTIVQRDVSAFQRQCEAELYAAEPAIKKAEAALNGLDKASLTELKGLANPPKDLLSVTAAVQYMLAKKGTNFKKLDVSWAAGKKMMGNVDSFLRSLQEFDKDRFEPENKEWVRKLTGPADAPDPTFTAEYMKSKSFAAAGLCDWVVNICIYHDIYLDVEPKRQLLAEAEAKLAEANGKLAVVKGTVAALDERKAQLQGQLVQATEEKNRLLDAAARTAKRLNLAERLVNGLKDENERWGAGVEFLKEQKALLVGDVMVAASFLAYIGPFNEVFRSQLRNDTWLLDLQGRDLPITEDVDPLKMLTDDATVAAWKSERLPADRLSIENGTSLLQSLALYHHTPLILALHPRPRPRLVPALTLAPHPRPKQARSSPTARASR